MKINTNIQKAPKGVTLIELSVVIAVILVLISVLFVGASYYRTSANRAACVINSTSIKKAADSYMNIQNATTVTTANLTATTGPLPAGLPTCPDKGAYTISIPVTGVASSLVTCGFATHP